MAPIPRPATSADPRACNMTVDQLKSQAESYHSVMTDATDTVVQDLSFFNHNRAFVKLVRASSDFLFRQCTNLRDLQGDILGVDGSRLTSDQNYIDAWLETFQNVLEKFDSSIGFDAAEGLVEAGLSLSAMDLCRLPDGSTLDVPPVDEIHALGISHIASLMAFSQVLTDNSGYSPPIFHPADGMDEGPDPYDPHAFIEAVKSIKESSLVYLDCIVGAQSVTLPLGSTEFQRHADLFADCVDRTAGWFILHGNHLVKLREALYGPDVKPQIGREEWLMTVRGLGRRFSQGLSHADAGQVADTFHQMQVTDNTTEQITHITGSFRPDNSGHAMGMIMLGLGRDFFGQLLISCPRISFCIALRPMNCFCMHISAFLDCDANRVQKVFVAIPCNLYFFIHSKSEASSQAASDPA